MSSVKARAMFSFAWLSLQATKLSKCSNVNLPRGLLPGSRRIGRFAAVLAVAASGHGAAGLRGPPKRARAGSARLCRQS
eukprot:4299854-Lingulodinium_polyedra.AAC.1